MLKLIKENFLYWSSGKLPICYLIGMRMWFIWFLLCLMSKYLYNIWIEWCSLEYTDISIACKCFTLKIKCIKETSTIKRDQNDYLEM